MFRIFKSQKNPVKLFRFTFFPSFNCLDVKCYMAFGRGNLHVVNFCFNYVGYVGFMPNITLSFAVFVLRLTEILNGDLHDLNDFASVSA